MENGIYPSQELINRMRDYVKVKNNLDEIMEQASIYNPKISDNDKKAIAQCICEQFEKELFTVGTTYTFPATAEMGSCEIEAINEQEITQDIIDAFKEFKYGIDDIEDEQVMFPSIPTDFKIASISKQCPDTIAVVDLRMPGVYIYTELWATFDAPEEHRMEYDFGTDLLKLYNDIFNEKYLIN